MTDDVRVESRRDAREGHGDTPARTPDAPTVVVADDDEQSRRALAHVLEAEGIAVVEAASFAECLTSVQLLRPDALVLARDLPEPPTTDAVTAIRAADDGDGLPIVLLAHQDRTDGIRTGLQTGADDVVLRPFDPGEVLARVRARWRQRAAWLSRLERRRASHAVVVDTLARAQVDGDARDAAALVCRTIRRLPGIDFAAVLAFEGGDRAVLLSAVTGVDATTAREMTAEPLSSRQTRTLRERAENGAWVARAADAVPALRDVAPEQLVCAAVRDRGELVAVLALGGNDPRGAERPTGRLTMATELAAVAAGCLAPALDADAQARSRSRLTDVIAGRAFGVVLQPIVELGSRARVGLEASIRYDDGVEARDRLHEAHRLGLAADLQLATLEAITAVSARLPADSRLAVDVSPVQLATNPDIVPLLTAIERPLVVELSERDRVDDYGALRSALRALGRGVEVAVDDVGSGYATLRHVLALHPTFVKLDEAWVHDVDQDAARQALIAGLGYFATYTGCRLVGTGVRNEHEATALAGLGVTLGQGPLFGTPRAPRRRA
ncbi:MAG TPA: EAL domain-containing protein [Acidimicrobiia bacterium]